MDSSGLAEERTLTTFPPEIIEKMAERLDARSVASLSQTCWFLHDATLNSMRRARRGHDDRREYEDAVGFLKVLYGVIRYWNKDVRPGDAGRLLRSMCLRPSSADETEDAFSHRPRHVRPEEAALMIVVDKWLYVRTDLKSVDETAELVDAYEKLKAPARFSVAMRFPKWDSSGYVSGTPLVGFSEDTTAFESAKVLSRQCFDSFDVCWK